MIPKSGNRLAEKIMSGGRVTIGTAAILGFKGDFLRSVSKNCDAGVIRLLPWRFS
jgi:hypothetical protein